MSDKKEEQVKKICSVCGSDDIIANVKAFWVVDLQQWVIANPKNEKNYLRDHRRDIRTGHCKSV